MRVTLAWLAIALPGPCAQSPDDTSDPCRHEPPLDYDNFGKGFMEKHCTGCHSSIIPPSQRNEAPAEANFDTYEGVLIYAGRIHARTVYLDPTPMPPGGGPTELEVDLVDEWMLCSVFPDVSRWQQEGGSSAE